MRYFRLLCLFFLFSLVKVNGQKAYFIDGYHGGVWGHFPEKYTAFMVEMLNKHPEWKINLEIEPETWDHVKIKDPESYNKFKKIFEDQTSQGRVENVNPSYAQSYLYNISGESIIRQFEYGIKKTKEHFPNAVFSTYSSEEPCFTSALPQILKSFGFKYASLKNPNTCWGGYTQAFGGELVNWIGPDGTKLPTSPRYGIEKLLPNSTWETNANNNSKEFISAAFNDGIKHPVGMCLQDAGWRFGKWLGNGSKCYQPTEYTTWRQYFEEIAIKEPTQDWKFSQEDVLVSLVWGSQIAQKIAQQVRKAEVKITSAEKIAAMANVFTKAPYPNDAFDIAWHNLLLSQHHDCWIVPYNSHKGLSWAQHVNIWTTNTTQKSDSIIQSSGKYVSNKESHGNNLYLKVYNTTAYNRNEALRFELPDYIAKSKNLQIVDCSSNKEVASQRTKDGTAVIFKPDVPSIGYNTYCVKSVGSAAQNGVSIVKKKNGQYIIESDLYRITLNENKGGAIESIIAKKFGSKEFVDQSNERSFNELRGNFYDDGGFKSSTENKADIEIIESGPLVGRVKVKGTIAGVPFTQIITVANGERKIDCTLKIDWVKNMGIGAYSEKSTYTNENHKKAFYNDKYKLLVLFPSNLSNQKVYKNAPFDVTESRLKNTFFDSWDSIKNNIILNWVDVLDNKNDYGVALFSDHTTSYTHGEDFPLGLNVQYSGRGLFGPDYKIDSPTEIHYAIVPHKGKWDKSSIWSENVNWNEPLVISVVDKGNNSDLKKSLINVQGKGWEIPSITKKDNDLIVRLFNAESDNSVCKIRFAGKSKGAEIVELNGEVVEKITPSVENNIDTYSIHIPRFGFRTIRFIDVQN